MSQLFEVARKVYQMYGGGCLNNVCIFCLEDLDDIPEEEIVRIPVPGQEEAEHCFHAHELRQHIVIAMQSNRIPLNPIDRRPIPQFLVDELISREDLITEEERERRREEERERREEERERERRREEERERRREEERRRERRRREERERRREERERRREEERARRERRIEEERARRERRIEEGVPRSWVYFGEKGIDGDAGNAFANIINEGSLSEIVGSQCKNLMTPEGYELLCKFVTDRGTYRLDFYNFLLHDEEGRRLVLGDDGAESLDVERIQRIIDDNYLRLQTAKAQAETFPFLTTQHKRAALSNLDDIEQVFNRRINPRS